jgi:hypothetical protein
VSKIDDGGAAFPDPCGAHNGAFPPDCAKGMSLRDYFAAAALPSILSYSNEVRMKADAEFSENNQIHRAWDKHDDAMDDEVLAYRAGTCAIAAYTIADAMLAARKEAQP